MDNTITSMKIQRIQPRTKAEEALDIIQRIRPDSADDLAIARCKKIAEESMLIDPVASNLILGTIAALRWDDEAIRKHFLEAYRLSHHPVVLENYSLALQNIQKVADAAAIAESASNASPTDLRLLHVALSSTMAAGRFEKALSLAEAYKLRAPHDPASLGTPLTCAIDALKENNVPMTAVIQAHDITYAVLHESKVQSTSYTLDTEQMDQMVTCTIFVDLHIDQILELDALLADRLFDEMEELYLADFLIGFEPKEINGN
jgi:hypothetical protein